MVGMQGVGLNICEVALCSAYVRSDALLHKEPFGVLHRWRMRDGLWLK
jgi:hypothetical protein